MRTRQRNFDAVVADSKLPDMDGISLLNEIMVSYPRAVRVVLSEFDNVADTVNCVARIHRHLLKPCNANTLANALDRALVEATWLPNQEARRLLSHLNWVPSPPRQYFEITREIASPTSSLESIGELISSDPPIAAKILQLANSAVFGLQLEVTSLAEAVGYLGAEVTRSLVLLAHTFAEFEKIVPRGFAAEALWSHSVSVARFAKLIAGVQRLPSDAEEQAYSAGLLHDLGKIVLAANLPDAFSEALSRARETRAELHRIESGLFGANHAEIGACLLGIWSLPNAVVEAVALHHDPSASSSTEFGPVAAVHVANAFGHQWQGEAGTSLLDKLDGNYLKRLGISDQLPVWGKHCRNGAQTEVPCGA